MKPEDFQHSYATTMLWTWWIVGILFGIAALVTVWAFRGIIGKKGPYAYAKCKGCDNTVAYDKCRNCNRNATFRIAESWIQCLNCRHEVRESLACPVCNTAILIDEFRI